VLSHPQYSTDLAPADAFYCDEGTRFEAVSLIQQTVTRELKAIEKKRFLGHSIRCINDVNVVRNRAGTLLSDCINKYFYLFVVFMVSVRELNCHTV
jgi:hypothetical protein